MKQNIQFLRALLLKEMEEKKMCKECGAIMEEGMCNECGYMEEMDYEESGLTHPEKADRDKNKDISSWEKKVGSAIEKNMSEGGDHEVSMAHNSLESIIKSAQDLMSKLGSDERDIPGWIQDHITNAENYIDQAAQGFHELTGGAEPEMEPEPQENPLDGVLEAMIMEAKKKKKPSAGMTKKQKSAVVKKAKAGKDIGKKGKGFEAVEKKAKESGAKNPKAVAAAAMWKGAAKRSK